MLTEWSFMGFLLPPLAVPVFIALALFLVLRKIGVKLRLYHWFAQPVLVDLALYALLLWFVLWVSDSLPVAG